MATTSPVLFVIELEIQLVSLSRVVTTNIVWWSAQYSNTTCLYHLKISRIIVIKNCLPNEALFNWTIEQIMLVFSLYRFHRLWLRKLMRKEKYYFSHCRISIVLSKIHIFRFDKSLAQCFLVTRIKLFRHSHNYFWNRLIPGTRFVGREKW